MTTKTAAASYSAEVWGQAVRVVLEGGGDHPGQCAEAAKVSAAQPLERRWRGRSGRLLPRSAARRRPCARGCAQWNVTTDKRPGPLSAGRDRIKAPERDILRAVPGDRNPAQGRRVLCHGGTRPPVGDMVAFLDDRRQASGVEPIVPGAADRPAHRPRLCGTACRPRQAAGTGPERHCADGRDPARVRGELQCLRRAQGLAAAWPRRDQGSLHCHSIGQLRPLHGRSLDAAHGAARGRAGQEGERYA